MDAVGINRYVRLLASADAEQRRQAIIALGRSKHPAALRPLAEVYRREHDQELRALALRAGQYIQAQTTQQPVPVEPATAAGAQQAPELTARPGVSRRAERAAKAAIEDTLSFQTRGDIARAVKSLKKAYQINPTLIDDTFFVGLATSILNCDEAGVPAALQDDSRAAEVVKASDKQKAQTALAAHIEQATRFRWASVSLDLVIFGLIMAFGPVLLVLILGESLQSWLVLVQSEAAAPNETLATVARFFGKLDAAALVVLSVTLLFSSLLSLVVQCVAIHICATRYLGGAGTLRFLMYKLISYANRYLLTVFVAAFAGIWLCISNGFPVALWLFAGGLALFSLVRFIKLGDKISEAYKFSAGGGCLSVIVASVVLLVSNGAIAYLVYRVLSIALASVLA